MCRNVYKTPAVLWRPRSCTRWGLPTKRYKERRSCVCKDECTYQKRALGAFADHSRSLRRRGERPLVEEPSFADLTCDEQKSGTPYRDLSLFAGLDGWRARPRVQTRHARHRHRPFSYPGRRTRPPGCPQSEGAIAPRAGPTWPHFCRRSTRMARTPVRNPKRCLTSGHGLILSHHPSCVQIRDLVSFSD